MGGEADLLKFSVSGAAGGAISSRVSAKLNNYGRAIPYAGPFIGFLGDTDTLSFNAFIQGNAAIRQETKLTTQFARDCSPEQRSQHE